MRSLPMSDGGEPKPVDVNADGRTSIRLAADIAIRSPAQVPGFGVREDDWHGLESRAEELGKGRTWDEVWLALGGTLAGAVIPLLIESSSRGPVLVPVVVLLVGTGFCAVMYFSRRAKSRVQASELHSELRRIRRQATP